MRLFDVRCPDPDVGQPVADIVGMASGQEMGGNALPLVSTIAGTAGYLPASYPASRAQLPSLGSQGTDEKFCLAFQPHVCPSSCPT